MSTIEQKIKELLEGTDPTAAGGGTNDGGTGPEGDNSKIEDGKGKKLEDRKVTGSPASDNPDNAKNNVDKNPVSEHVDALTAGEELSEEFKAKAAAIMEAAIAEGVAAEKLRLDEEYAQRLDEAVAGLRDDLVKEIDGYLSTIVEKWEQENEIALERGIRSEVTENFIDGLKKLFVEHYIDVPEDKLDLLDEQASQIDELIEALDMSVGKLESLEEEIVSLKRSSIIESTGSSMTVTDKEKFAKLCEGLVYEDEDSFKEKVEVIRESHFSNKVKSVKSVIPAEDSPVQIQEEVTDAVMKAYTSALNSPLTFKR